MLYPLQRVSKSMYRAEILLSGQAFWVDRKPLKVMVLLSVSNLPVNSLQPSNPVTIWSSFSFRVSLLPSAVVGLACFSIRVTTQVLASVFPPAGVVVLHPADKMDANKTKDKNRIGKYTNLMYPCQILPLSRLNMVVGDGNLLPI